MTDPQWVNRGRVKKARQVIAVLKHYLNETLDTANGLDIGCGNGVIAREISLVSKSMVGLDPEPWDQWNNHKGQSESLFFIVQSAESLPFATDTFDFIICNQVYEHVNDPEKMMSEIYRVLKPGGYCYFAGPNLLSPYEPHVKLPFVHWLPRPIGTKVSAFFNRNRPLDAFPRSYWTIMKWLEMYHVQNALPYALKRPDQVSLSFLQKTIGCVPDCLIRGLTFLSPGFIFMIQK